MRRSLKVLLLGIAIPGALSPVIYAAITHDDDRHVRVRHIEVADMDRDLEAEIENELKIELDIDIPRGRFLQVAVGGDRCEVGVERHLTLDDVAGLGLAVDAGSGSLTVTGVEGQDELRVIGRLCASSEELMEDLDVTLRRDSDRVLLDTSYPSSNGGWGNNYARIDLRVEAPAGMAADLRDSSGAIHVSGLGDLSIDDSSGEIEVEGIRGSVRIDDSSGEIRLRDVAGDVDVQDGSGEIEIESVTGSVVLRDGSGDIDIADVTVDVRITADGSGGIEVSNVGGDFVVERDGSGRVEHSGVRGRVDVPRKNDG